MPKTPNIAMPSARRLAEARFDAVIEAASLGSGEEPVDEDYDGVVDVEPAAALPEVSADGKRFTVRIRPGIFFDDDPAFDGRPRELVAAEAVTALVMSRRRETRSGGGQP